MQYFYGLMRHEKLMFEILRLKDMYVFTPEDQWATVEQLKTMHLGQILDAMPTISVGLTDYGFRQRLPSLHLADGTTVSVQASENHYSTPRRNFGPYKAVEVGFPSIDPGELWREYQDGHGDPTHSVFAYVPIELVYFFIGAHGGIDYEKTFENFQYGLR